VDIRIITATNVDLALAVEEGRFREDLFYRLNVIPITMPPLRERLEDVPLLVEHFLARLAATRGSLVTGLTPEASARLLAYDWPGHVRELANLVERMVTLADGPVLAMEDLPAKLLEATEGRPVPELPLALAEEPAQPEPADEAPAEIPPVADLPDAGLPDLDFPPEGVDFNALVSAYETRLITAALEAAGGVRNKAAQLLKLNRTTLVEKMRKKGLLGDSLD
jgi:DNA-binding NtrC family response regulator